jgi:hypothetical protein
MPDEADDLGAKLRFALDLFEAAEELMRRRLRRENPAISDEEIDSCIASWLQDRPGAPYGDAPGRPRSIAAFNEPDR